MIWTVRGQYSITCRVCFGSREQRFNCLLRRSPQDSGFRKLEKAKKSMRRYMDVRGLGKSRTFYKVVDVCVVKGLDFAKMGLAPRARESAENGNQAARWQGSVLGGFGRRCRTRRWRIRGSAMIYGDSSSWPISEANGYCQRTFFESILQD